MLLDPQQMTGDRRDGEKERTGRIEGGVYLGNLRILMQQKRGVEMMKWKSHHSLKLKRD